MVSLYDIAGILGVSVATVSKGLRGFRDVSPAMQAEIRRVAKCIGYGSIRERREKKSTRIIGIVYEKQREDDEGLAEALMQELTRLATSVGYGCLFLRHAGADPPVSYLAQARYNRLCAVIILQADVYHRNVVHLVRSEIPTLILCSPFSIPVHIVCESDLKMRAAERILKEIESILEISCHGFTRPRHLYLQETE